MKHKNGCVRENNLKLTNKPNLSNKRRCHPAKWMQPHRRSTLRQSQWTIANIACNCNLLYPNWLDFWMAKTNDRRDVGFDGFPLQLKSKRQHSLWIWCNLENSRIRTLTWVSLQVEEILHFRCIHTRRIHSGINGCKPLRKHPSVPKPGFKSFGIASMVSNK